MVESKETKKLPNTVDTWRNLGVALSKTNGSTHYITDEVQAIELISSIGELQGFCISSIIKYASRYPETNNAKDLVKIIDYAQILIGKIAYDQARGEL